MFLYVKLFFPQACRFLLGSKRRLQVGRNQDLNFSLKTRPGQHCSNTPVLTSVVWVSHFGLTCGCQQSIFSFLKRRKIYISKKSDIYCTIWLHIILMIIFFPVTDMLIFNFHKITDMCKGYAYQFSDFISYKKPRIDVCVCCVLVLCTQRKQ